MKMLEQIIEMGIVVCLISNYIVLPIFLAQITTC